jgi:Rieske Fe-S protein
MEPNRRQFLTGACALLGAGLGAALLADSADAATGIKRKKNGQVEVTVAQIPGLENINGVVNLGTVKGVPTAVVRTGAATYTALNLRCPHAGVTVRDTGSEWLCPAHGSQFALDGAFISGPAGRALAPVSARLNRGILTVG